MSKRLFDWVMSSLGLLALGPILVLIALAVKLDSPGPVFFRQERVGRFGQPFRIHKFRTMRHEPAGKGLQITVGADRRITRVGHFLRASKLDELPQLLDVWQGTMSLVGPRPCLFNQEELIDERAKRGVFDARPGITGLAQVQGIDMSTPCLLAETDAKMLAGLSIATYFRYILATVTGSGRGDRIQSQPNDGSGR